jgi:ATP-dependent Clp protease ATP-binding subunit ClpX
VGLEELIGRRIGRSRIGFEPESSDSLTAQGENDRDPALLREVEVDDLVHYGMIPELLGRLPVHAVLDALSEVDLKRVMIEPRNAIIKQVQKYFEMENGTVTFTDEALTEIAKRAMKARTGVRAIRSIVEELLLDTLFDLPDSGRSRNYVITGAMARGEKEIRPRRTKTRPPARKRKLA